MTLLTRMISSGIEKTFPSNLDLKRSTRSIQTKGKGYFSYPVNKSGRRGVEDTILTSNVRAYGRRKIVHGWDNSGVQLSCRLPAYNWMFTTALPPCLNGQEEIQKRTSRHSLYRLPTSLLGLARECKPMCNPRRGITWCPFISITFSAQCTRHERSPTLHHPQFDKL